MHRQTVDQLSSFFPSKRDEYDKEKDHLRYRMDK